VFWTTTRDKNFILTSKICDLEDGARGITWSFSK
jgi:hypothetical protein